MGLFQKKKVKQSEDPNLDQEVLTDDIDHNLNRLKEEFSAPKNTDFIIKHLVIRSLNKKGVICYLNGATDAEAMERDIMKPLIEYQKSAETKDYAQFLMEHILTASTTNHLIKLQKCVQGILTGSVVLLIEDCPAAAGIEIPLFQARSVEKPGNELVIKGPKEAFVESGSVNISLVRKQLKNKHLITENLEVGKGGENRFYLMYLGNLANPDLVNRVKKRVNDITSLYVEQLSDLEQRIEERPYSLVPSSLLTERPDRACAYLREGHVILLNDVSPYALITPVTFFTLIQTAEDYYERWAFGNFIRLLRLVATFVALLTPSIYIAATNYSPEMLQTDLLLAIAATREIVPFPAIIEVLLMELIFELLREAGIRIPTAIGPTIGIVGALILGQAAVQANIVSPIIVIVVALTGLASFAIPEVNLSYIIRILRFAFLFVASILGFYGIALLFVVCLAYMASVRTFGVAFLSPLTPHLPSSGDTIFRPLLWKMWLYPQHLDPKKLKRAPKPDKRGAENEGS